MAEAEALAVVNGGWVTSNTGFSAQDISQPIKGLNLILNLIRYGKSQYDK